MTVLKQTIGYRYNEKGKWGNAWFVLSSCRDGSALTVYSDSSARKQLEERIILKQFAEQHRFGSTTRVYPHQPLPSKNDVRITEPLYMAIVANRMIGKTHTTGPIWLCAASILDLYDYIKLISSAFEAINYPAPRPAPDDSKLALHKYWPIPFRPCSGWQRYYDNPPVPQALDTYLTANRTTSRENVSDKRAFLRCCRRKKPDKNLSKSMPALEEIPEEHPRVRELAKSTDDLTDDRRFLKSKTFRSEIAIPVNRSQTDLTGSGEVNREVIDNRRVDWDDSPTTLTYARNGRNVSPERSLSPPPRPATPPRFQQYSEHITREISTSIDESEEALHKTSQKIEKYDAYTRREYRERSPEVAQSRMRPGAERRDVHVRVAPTTDICREHPRFHPSPTHYTPIQIHREPMTSLLSRDNELTEETYAGRSPITSTSEYVSESVPPHHKSEIEIQEADDTQRYPDHTKRIGETIQKRITYESTPEITRGRDHTDMTSRRYQYSTHQNETLRESHETSDYATAPVWKPSSQNTAVQTPTAVFYAFLRPGIRERQTRNATSDELINQEFPTAFLRRFSTSELLDDGITEFDLRRKMDRLVAESRAASPPGRPISQSWNSLSKEDDCDEDSASRSQSAANVSKWKIV
ncbi:hypothetical protein AB6A40_004464 [Gnathostoma spinigerum]|uniref:Uncharacterized protein n=1 Tax=Gnathostoma spinigerum TaxID=75299 RepID=A0ABD6EDP8_9BILA